MAPRPEFEKAHPRRKEGLGVDSARSQIRLFRHVGLRMRRTVPITD